MGSAMTSDMTSGPATDLHLEPVDERVTEAAVTRWHAPVGDAVNQREPLLEVSTDEVDTDILEPVTGRLATVHVEEGATVEIGTLLARIETDSQETPEPETPPDTQPEADVAAPEPAPVSAALEPTTAWQPTTLEPLPYLPDVLGGSSASSGEAAVGFVGVAPVTELVHTTALARGVDLDGLAGSGVGGRMRLVDVLSASVTLPPVGFVPAVMGTVYLDALPDVLGTLTKADDRGSPAAIAELVRMRADELGVDLDVLETGSGTAGRIRLSDVTAATPTLTPVAQGAPFAPRLASLDHLPALAPMLVQRQSGAAAPRSSVPALANASSPMLAPQAAGIRAAENGGGSGVGIEAVPRMKRMIAQRKVDSLRVSTQLTTVVEIDVTDMVRTRLEMADGFAARVGSKLTVTPFFAAATVHALGAHEFLNASISDDETQVTYHPHVHLDVSVDTERGLVAPTIRNAGDLTLSALAKTMTKLAQRARSGDLTTDERSDGTFTLTYTDSTAALFDTPIINQPQVGILGLGAITRRPMVMGSPGGGEAIAVRSMMYAALTYDHRLVDGADAARFLTTLKDLLEDLQWIRAIATT